MLATTGGSLAIVDPTNGFDVIVVRTSDTTFATLSNVCTHQGCLVNFNAALQLLVCPCHGSEFDLTGAVKHSPAVVPLRTYPNSFDAAANVLTITVS